MPILPNTTVEVVVPFYCAIVGQHLNVECLYKQCAHAQSKFKSKKKKK